MDRSEDPDGKLLGHVQASVSSLKGHLAFDAVLCPFAHGHFLIYWLGYY